MDEKKRIVLYCLVFPDEKMMTVTCKVSFIVYLLFKVICYPITNLFGCLLLYYQLIQYTTIISNITDIEFIEQKSFEVCDTDEDGGLTWNEVKLCVVCILYSLAQIRFL